MPFSLKRWAYLDVPSEASNDNDPHRFVAQDALA
jgi:hypothetical protein